MPAVAATIIQPQTYVRLQTSWADQPSVSYVRFVRVNPDTCEEVAVRVHTAYDASGEYILVSCDGTAVVWDTEAPLGVDLEYRVEGLGSTVTATSTLVNIDDNGELHLKDPLSPCNDIRVATCIDDSCTDSDPGTFYIGHSGDIRPAHTISLLPVMASTPISRSRTRQKPTSMLMLGTQDCDDAEAIVAINAAGTPLLWQSLPEYCMEDRYITVGDVATGRIGVDQRLQDRTHAMPYLVTHRPAGPGNGPCGVRWNDLCDIYPTWDAMAAAGLTWNDLLLGFASGSVGARRTWDDVEAEFTNWDDVEASNVDWNDVRELP